MHAVRHGAAQSRTQAGGVEMTRMECPETHEAVQRNRIVRMATSHHLQHEHAHSGEESHDHCYEIRNY